MALYHDGNTINKKQDIVECLNKFFKSMFIVEKDLNFPEVIHVPNNYKNLDSAKISQKEILDLLKNLDIKKSTGPDGIPGRILEELKEEIISPLHLIFNKSLNEGEVPSDWKLANVTPIFKGGGKSDPKNHRPISITSIVCRLLLL